MRLGAEFLAPQEVVKPCVQHSREVSTRAVALTTGVSYRTLDVPGMDRLSGAGVYYGAARTEARSCDEQDVYIAGGGNSAGAMARVASAVGEGSMALKFVHQYLDV